jgi:hypothetical protein
MQCFKNRTGRLNREPEDNRSDLIVGSDMLLNRWNRREPGKTGPAGLNAHLDFFYFFEEMRLIFYFIL